MGWVIEKNMSDFLCLRFKDINLHARSEVFWTALSSEWHYRLEGLGHQVVMDCPT